MCTVNKALPKELHNTASGMKVCSMEAHAWSHDEDSGHHWSVPGYLTMLKPIAREKQICPHASMPPCVGRPGCHVHYSPLPNMGRQQTGGAPQRSAARQFSVYCLGGKQMGQHSKTVV